MIKNTLIFLFLAVIWLQCSDSANSEAIDRKALVTRHNITVHGFDSLASLSVGNGNFAFTTDLTGLQTFYQEYEKGVPLGTQSNRGWHTFPDTAGYRRSETLKYWEVQGRSVSYRDQLSEPTHAKNACNYFRENPQRLHLGMIGLVLVKMNGEEAQLTDIKNATHHLDLWTGEVTSNFEFEGKPVKVTVYCHQDRDLISARIESPLISEGKLGISWKFSAPLAVSFSPGYDFASPDMHQSVLEKLSSNEVMISRSIDTTRYQVAISWKGNANIIETGQHVFRLQPQSGKILEFSCEFAQRISNISLPGFAETRQNNKQSWQKFWQSGGAVDFSGCTDPRAAELERRVVLSQYLTKIQSSGDLPPAETGLTYNSWYGKYHMEMQWWHIDHFVLWNRPQYMYKQLEYFNEMYENARKTAIRQGYKGVRWQKMQGPDEQNSPSSVGSYLIWQQPHFIWFAEQMYQLNPTRETIEKYKKLVFATAEFMADFPVWNKVSKQYDLAPPLIPAQELWPRATTTNPPFELAYWYWGLSTAQQWKERLGEPKEKKWEEVRLNLAAPDQADSVYLGVQGATDSYTNPNLMRDHPIVLAAYGLLPEWEKIDPEIMRKTMHVIAKRWNWSTTWGWDYPMAAMTAVRLGEPEMALDFLLKDVQKNTYLVNGHNYQSPRLTVYLPGNGGLLTTVAMMCAGWEGCSTKNPGFPKNGKWNVKWENLRSVF
ncbi:MAG TPA: hypothetical protein VE912_21100 [Bacteroidales bacterium]|nr:hypothetical protein [Bacteroidales bacterium]